MTSRLLSRLRKLCLDLPEAREVEAWGAPTFRVKTIVATYSGPGEYGSDERPSAWIKADKTNQELMVAAQPERFFVPPYVGPRGWVGVYLDSGTDWDGLEQLLWDAWRMSVPKRLAAQYSEGRG